MKFDLSADIGKWFTPSIGFRVGYQGWEIKNADNVNCDYSHFYGSLMWNVLGANYYKSERVRWSVVPFIGAGLLLNSTYKQKSFALSYGIMAQYKFAQRVGLNIELSNAMAFSAFDGIGDNEYLADNILSLKVGLSFTLGRVGWKRAESVKPYQWNNEWLNERLSTYTDATDDTPHERNNYAGLNSLRARIAERNAHQEEHNDFYEIEEEIVEEEDTRVTVGDPIFFYFDIGTVNLVNEIQREKISAIAQLVAQGGISVVVSGATDSATGSAKKNKELSSARANFIADELILKGVDPSVITLVSKGGISEYTPNEANRNTEVVLFIDE